MASGATRAAGKPAIEAIETESGGKLHVSGQARPGTTTNLHLNDRFIADDRRRLSVTINKDVVAGAHHAGLGRRSARVGHF